MDLRRTIMTLLIFVAASSTVFQNGAFAQSKDEIRKELRELRQMMEKMQERIDDLEERNKILEQQAKGREEEKETVTVEETEVTPEEPQPQRIFTVQARIRLSQPELCGKPARDISPVPGCHRSARGSSALMALK